MSRSAASPAGDEQAPPNMASAAGALATMTGEYLVVGAALRLVWLFRPDPFGDRLVAGLARPLLVATGLDVLQAGLLLLAPAAALLLGLVWRRGAGLALRLHFALLLFATALAVIDEEVVRFSGDHVSLVDVRTYVNPASLEVFPAFFRNDAGGPYLGVVLLLGSAVLLAVWMARTMARRQLRAPLRRVATLFLGLAAAALVVVSSHGLTRRWRLTPPVLGLVEAWRARAQPAATRADVSGAIAKAQERWLVANPSAPANQSTFPLAAYPLLHVSPHTRCVLAAANRLDPGALVGCDRDADGDGSLLATDCNDAEPSIHPGAADVPADGIDQDCSGTDAGPFNVLLIVLESFRAANVGHLRPDDGARAVTPALDRLAEDGVTFARAVSNGLPTITSFMTIHTGLLPHPDTFVATAFPRAEVRSLPQILGARGYTTRFFTAADPSWDNQTPWLRRWYEAVDYDGTRERDADLLAHVERWLVDEWPRTSGGINGSARPFFVTVMTRTNHFPFDRIEGVGTTGGDTTRERMRDTMHYTDAAVGRLVALLREQPFWSRTIVVVTGDHGFPLGEHGTSRLLETAHVEATGVPLVFVGGSPAVARLGRGRRMDPASHVDIVPTLLDLLGVDPSGCQMGRSLVQGGHGTSLTLAPMEWAAERGPSRVLVDPRSWPDATSVSAYDRTTDWLERAPRQPDSSQRELAAELVGAARLMRYAYENDGLWPSWWPAAGW